MSLLTRQHFEQETERIFAEHRAEMIRALWIQGACVVTANAAILATVISLVEVLRQ
ncbi:MAG: hypothetical protein OXI51_14220 [Chloroflexota bacterium]|nr:hypothetical protein [Chloroflexota bacterium]